MKTNEVAALGDVVIVLRDSGRSGIAFIKGHKVPMDVDISYGAGKDDPPLAIRAATCKIGWTQAVWRKADKETRDAIGYGSEEWRAQHEDEAQAA